ncbi:amidohydrolase family protein [Natrononativus amylolyticus]|uniref:amidohydrolase family protein n=1 Tax=Natrononativus amylolyticus TaxID=2963434 RepID=UPI0020CF06B6|nr:amidohydrolase family protein [Natrononativus amylolyticus]
MIDSHFHLWTEDNSTPEKRAERAEIVGEQAAALGVERIALIGERGESVAECRENNRTVGKYVEEYPDLFYGWARANPKWGEEGVAEFRRAVEEDGLIGLKLYAQVYLDDPRVEPFAEAAVEMDVPILSHVSQRNEPFESLEAESYSEHVVGLAEKFPDLKLLSAHIGGGGHWEHRIKNIQDYDNVYLDTSGSVCDHGSLEMAAEYLGTDRLVFGTDTWFLPGVGKLRGADLTPEEKADIAYNFENLIPETVPNKLSADAVAAGIDRARSHFEERAQPREETIVDANAYLGEFPWRPIDAEPDELLAKMDEKGVDRAVVSSLDAVFYRDVHRGNEELAAAIEDHEDRFIPFATIDPTFPGWRKDLRESVEELGMKGVRLFPAYHDYDIDDDAVVELLEACADYDVPAMFVATLEDKRQRHPRFKLRDHDDIRNKHWGAGHVEALIDALTRAPETDVIIANGWGSAPEIIREVATSYPSGVRLNNFVREGQTLFVLDDLFMFFRYQGADLVDELGVDRLVTGPKLPMLYFDSHYIYTENLPVSEDDKDRVRSENVLSLLE